MMHRPQKTKPDGATVGCSMGESEHWAQAPVIGAVLPGARGGGGGAGGTSGAANGGVFCGA